MVMSVGALGNRAARFTHAVLRRCIGVRLASAVRALQEGGAVLAQRGGGGDEHDAAKCHEACDAGERQRDRLRANPSGHRFLVAQLCEDAACGAMAKRRLDKAVAQLGDSNHDGDLAEVDPPGLGAHVAGWVHKQEQRVVPQVDAIGALSEPNEGLGREQLGQAAMRLRARGDDHQRE